MKAKKQELTTAMMDSISDVLETMFFLPMDFISSETATKLWSESSKQTQTIKIGFSGPFSGFLVLLIPIRLAENITADFMGLDSTEITKEHVNGTTQEIANMILGNIFSKYDDQAVFNLEIPEIISDANYKDLSPCQENELVFCVDTLDDYLIIKMIIDS